MIDEKAERDHCWKALRAVRAGEISTEELLFRERAAVRAEYEAKWAERENSIQVIARIKSTREAELEARVLQLEAQVKDLAAVAVHWRNSTK